MLWSAYCCSRHPGTSRCQSRRSAQCSQRQLPWCHMQQCTHCPQAPCRTRSASLLCCWGPRWDWVRLNRTWQAGRWGHGRHLHTQFQTK
jgi:hypothetical protein